MSKYIELGFKSDITTTNLDFETYTQDRGGNYNPYNQAFFNQPDNMSETKCTNKITSIPSPYARMHITELAFRELNSGAGIMTEDALRKKVLSPDYRRALSHCLDIYQLIFYSDKINLKEIGISISKMNLISTKDENPVVQKLFKDHKGDRNSLYYYINSLELFRNAYNKGIDQKKQNGNNIQYFFDFSSLYLINYNGETVAASSPFTGFYAKGDCDLRISKGNNTFEPIIEYNNHKYLTADENDWQGIAERPMIFREFLYLLFKESGLEFIFDELFSAVKKSLPNDGVNVTGTFSTRPEFSKFNFGENLLQKIQGQEVFLRQDGLDCSYLKYLLFLTEPIDLKISEEEYKEVDLDQRRFPKNGQTCRWIGANDLLSDALFILNYEINDNYYTIPYQDMMVDERHKNRCLLPIKKLAFDYYTVEEIKQRTTITKRRDGIFVLKFKITLEGGGETYIRKEYRSGNSIQFPNGIVIEGEDMNPFAIGIYPFIRSNHYRNIYKILFYNGFEKNYTLNFYRTDNNNIQPYVPYQENELRNNKTNNIQNQELPVNCEYYDLTSDSGKGLEFIEVGYYINENTKVTSIIYPKLREVVPNPGTTNVAIDLGTSNTYIAYTFNPAGFLGTPNIQEINTHHIDATQTEWNELTFMNKRCDEVEDPNAPEKNREDLYLRTSEKGKPVSTYLSSQLLEFIPSRIDPTLGDSYKFPIPTVVNFLRQDCTRNEKFENNLPLVHSSIPFAYYESGIRSGAQCYDLINDGRFKWFAEKRDGNFELKELPHACFKSFMAELLFIIRSHILCQGYPLNKCHLIWSYPLAFSQVLVDQYKNEWESAYKTYINDVNNIDDFVTYTNESRTPIFNCLTDPTTAVHLTLLLDIGGGSTDVIGYKNNKPEFITSFGFAGNSLYLEGEMNLSTPSENNEDRNPLLMSYIKKQNIFKNAKNVQKNGNNFSTQKIDLSRSISELMNYGFTQDSINFENIFKLNDKPQFFLLFHNAALIYHIAQLCRVKSPDEVPVAVYLTGNGSKLFNLLSNINKKDLIKEIFKYVYEHDGNEATQMAAQMIDQMTLPSQKNPKAATVYGALKGLLNGQLATADASKQDCVVMLGDKNSIYNVMKGFGGAKVDNSIDIKSLVKPNVEEFIDMFYNLIYINPTPAIKKQEVLDALEFIKDNDRIQIPANGLITESMFFQYIALIMQRLSVK